MFRTVLLSIIRSFSLYTQQWYMSYKFADNFLASCIQLVLLQEFITMHGHLNVKVCESLYELLLVKCRTWRVVTSTNQPFLSIYLVYHAVYRALAQTVRHLLLFCERWLHSQSSSCAIYGEQSGSLAGFFPITFASSVHSANTP